METVGRREFLRDTGRYLVPGEFVLTRNNKPEYVVKIVKIEEGQQVEGVCE